MLEDLLLIGSAEPLASWYVGLTPQHPGVVTVYGGDTETPSHREPPRSGGAVRTRAQKHWGTPGEKITPRVPPNLPAAVH
jgi:hypothetical protein